jgi:hypothetical protein
MSGRPRGSPGRGARSCATRVLAAFWAAGLGVSSAAGCTAPPPEEPPPPPSRMWPDPVPEAPLAPGGHAVFVATSFHMPGGRDFEGLAEWRLPRSYGYDYDHDPTREACALCRGWGCPEVPQPLEVYRDRQEDELPQEVLDRLNFQANGFALPFSINHVNTEAMRAGRISLAFAIDGLSLDAVGDLPEGESYRGGVTVTTHAARREASLGDDAWHPLTSSFRADGSPLARSTSAHVTSSMLVSGDLGTVLVPRLTAAGPFMLELRHAVLTLYLVSSHPSPRGVLMGVIAADDLDWNEARGYEAQALCFPYFADWYGIRHSDFADHLVDGSIDPTRPCDGLTATIAFTFELAELSDVPVPPEPVQAVSCPP